MDCRVRAHPVRFKTSTCHRAKRSSYVNSKSHQPKAEHVRATSASADAFDGGDRDVASGAALSVGAAAAGAGAPQGAAFNATVFNLVNVIMGAGYVSIPFACRQGGWVALGVLWLLGAVFCYTGNTILQCCERVDQQERQQQQQLLLQQQHQQAQPQQQQPASIGVQQQQEQQQQQQQQHLQSADAKLTANNKAAASPAAAAAAAPAVSPAGYEAVAGAAFGPLGRLLVSGVMYAELLGICCVYIVLEAEALSTLLGHTALGSWLSSSCGSNGYVLAASALIVPTVLLPSVEALAALGALGVMAAVTVGCVLSGLYSSTPAALTALSDTSFIHLSTLPQVLGVLAFVYAGHSTFPVIQQSMSQPAAGQRAVTFGYVITAAICTLIGGFGYALWGPATEQVVTANLSAGSLLALVLTALTAANPFSAFAVTLEPVALMLQQRLQKWRASKQQPGGRSSSDSSSSSGGSSSTVEAPYTVRATIRLGLALACCITAMLLPYVTDLMAFVGALLTMTISLILPALMHLQLFKQDMPGWLLVFDCVVVLLGVACAYVGATSAFSNLQQKLLAGAACA